eukprot:4860408-Pleurochrysis_carterae.AAC.1
MHRRPGDHPCKQISVYWWRQINYFMLKESRAPLVPSVCNTDDGRIEPVCSNTGRFRGVVMRCSLASGAAVAARVAGSPSASARSRQRARGAARARRRRRDAASGQPPAHNTPMRRAARKSPCEARTTLPRGRGCT